MTERHEAVRYFVEQDMMAIEIRPWPGTVRAMTLVQIW